MIILLICFKHFSQLSELKGVFMGDKKARAREQAWHRLTYICCHGNGGLSDISVKKEIPTKGEKKTKNTKHVT